MAWRTIIACGSSDDDQRRAGMPNSGGRLFRRNAMAAETDPGPKTARWKKILFTVVGVGLVLTLLELLGVFFYFIVVPRQSREMIELTLGIREPIERGATAMHYRPHPYFNYMLNPDFSYPDGRKPYNSHGFRMPEWPGRKNKGTLRIVALGGSTTFGMFATSGEDVWPAMVERDLRKWFSLAIEVYNLGVPGYTTNELLGVLSMLVPELEPDIVLIHCGANDAYAQAYPDEGGPDNSKFRFSWSYRQLPRLVHVALRASRLLRTFGVLLLSRGSYLPDDVLRLVQFPHPPDAQALENGKRAVGKYFKRNIKEMVALTRNLAAIPILLTHPLNPGWDATRKPFYQAVTAAHLRCNRICLELGGELRVPVIDLFPWMRDQRLFTDAIHVNDAGMRRQAKIVAEHLRVLIAEEWQEALPPAGD
jgi:lysophospholipase L1-like esterase